MHARDIRSDSHLVAWIGILFMIGGGLLLLSITSCRSALTYYQKMFVGNYKKVSIEGDEIRR
mgnify:CR=1 FL=1